MTVLTWIELIIIGLITGTITSLIGASGVTVVVPAMTILFSLNSHIAIGTSLLVDVITSIVVSISYIRHKNVRLQASIWITVGSILGAQLGSHWAGIISDTSLSGLFAIMLIISGISTLRKKDNNYDSNKGLHFKSKITQTLALLLIGFLIGIISGLVGAGGGVMVLLTIIFILHYPMHQAVGTSTVIMAITACSSLFGYASQGNVDYKYGLAIAIGAVVAGMIGSHIANKVNEAVLNKIVAWVFILLGFIMIGMKFLH
ncbi:sulfite exporter TauE/SafE family protein [uncultured Lactobacillus sp.]|uniref:sulfite exporter TauE/SafE family protein n=1 Tax=uncultured Lactobacillus sp. TaxID=153152 RepID=UPI002606FA6F|nr:sulfite exporter TauE/SafE family protein [uncultured Lactobacillus sp.]